MTNADEATPLADASDNKVLRMVFSCTHRYDLLPFYSRLVATLHPCMPDIASELVLLLKNDFKWHVRKKDQINIESKLKTVRFIGEYSGTSQLRPPMGTAKLSS